MPPVPPAGIFEVTTMKRKREAFNETNSSFHVHQIGQNTQLHFESITTILRAHLPLAWLSTTSQHLPAGAVVEGQIRNIERWEYHVLFARQSPNGGLHVFERVDADTYTVYPVQPFVSESWVYQAAIGAAPPLSLQSLLHYTAEPESILQVTAQSRKSSMSSEANFKLRKNRRGAIARSSILGSASTMPVGSPRLLADSPQEFDSKEHDQDREELTTVDGQEGTTHEFAPSDKVEAQNATLEAAAGSGEYIDHLTPEYLRQRYLEMLYATKTSLAYYAKGPLGRARARARVADSSMNSLELATFYRGSLLPHKKLDIKYRASLKDVVTHSTETSVTDTKQSPEKTKKPSKKRRLGKDGLWPAEPGHIARWWHSRPLRRCDSEAEKLHEIDTAIAAQRIREIQIQILLILEILSIETRDQKSPQTSEDPGSKIESTEVANDPALRQKASRDLQADLNLLADKLCIWHSIGIETVAEMTASNHSNNDHQMQTVDCLRNFCTDVIIPFYSSKLPLICKGLCRTLAGSELAEQASRRQARCENDKKILGATVTRRVPSVGGPISTEDRSVKDSQQHLISTLHRSSTLPVLRRETSQVLQQPTNQNRGLQRSASLMNREMDLTVDAQITASKKRKLDLIAAQKHELEKAIQALKKPDRSMAGRVYMDEVNRRLQANRAVQIDATPSHNRSRRKTMAEEDDGFELPAMPKPLELIPSSTGKSRGLGLSRSSRTSATKRAVLSAIHDTPSKHQTHVDMNVRDTLVTPSEEISQLVFATPVKIKTVNASIEAIFSTPKQHRSQSKNKKDFEIPAQAGQAMKRAMLTSASAGGGSIYDTLGWDDDYDV